MNEQNIFGGIIALLLGGLFFLNRKKNSAEALVDNQTSKTELNKLDQGIAKNTGLAEAEEQKRADITKETEIEKENSDLLMYFNKPTK